MTALLSGSRLRRLALLALLIGGAILSSAHNSQFSRRERAYYADPKVVNFVRPGLVINIRSANIAQDGTITAHLTIQDPQGLPLDRNGVNTPGSVSTSFIVATIPAGQAHIAALGSARVLGRAERLIASHPGIQRSSKARIASRSDAGNSDGKESNISV